LQLLAQIAPTRLPSDVSARDVARALACAQQTFAAANGKTKIPSTQALVDDFLDWAKRGAEIQQATFTEGIYSSLPEHVQDDAEANDDIGGWQLPSVRFATPSSASGVVTREEEALNRVFVYAARAVWRSAVRYARQVSDSDGVQGLVEEGVLQLQGWVAAAAAAAQDERGNYSQWAVRKEMRLQALLCLRAMPLVTPGELHQLRQAAATRAARSAKHATPATRRSARGKSALQPHSARGAAEAAAGGAAPTPLRPTAEQRQLWAAVGAALKAVDHTLLQEWTEWSDPVFSTAACCGKWGEFLPRTRTAVDTSALRAIQEKYAPGGGAQAPRGRADTAATSDSKAAEDMPPAMRADAPGVDSWEDGDRAAGLQLLQELSHTDRQALASSRAAASAKPPHTPLLSRDTSAEAAPSRFEFRVRGVPGAAPLQQALRTGGAAAQTKASHGTRHKLAGEEWEDAEEMEELNAAVASAGSTIAGACAHPGLAQTRVVHGPAELVLAWRLPKGSPPVAFYLLETCGAEGSPTHKGAQWSVLLQDPPSAQASSGGRPRGGKTVRSLHAGVTYPFRIRAFNEAGASSFAFGAFTTAPLPPPAPVPVTLGPTSVKVNWGEGASCRWAARQLGAVVGSLTADAPAQSGCVSAAALLDAARWHGPLRTWMQSTPVDVRLLRAALLGGAASDAGAASVWTALEERWMAHALQAAQEAAPESAQAGRGGGSQGGLLAQAAARCRREVSLPELCALLGWDVVQAVGKGGSSPPPRVSLGACIAASAVAVLLDPPEPGDAAVHAVWGGMLLPAQVTVQGGAATLRESHASLRSSLGSALGPWAQGGASSRTWGWWAPAPGATAGGNPDAASALWSCSKAQPGVPRPWNAQLGAGVPAWSAEPAAARYALLQCMADDAPEGACHLAPPPPVSRDGHADPHPGQTWQELGVGQGFVRGVSSLSPGSSLVLAAQALNADGIASSLSAAAWVCTRLVSPPQLGVHLAPLQGVDGGASSGAACIQLKWAPADVPPSPPLPAVPAASPRNVSAAGHDVGDSLGMSVSGDLGEMAGGPMSGASHRDPSARMALMAQHSGDDSAHQAALRAVLAWAGQQASVGGANVAGLWTAFADGGSPEVPLPLPACRALLQYLGCTHALSDTDDAWTHTLRCMGAEGVDIVHFPDFVRWWARQGGANTPLSIRRSAGVTSASTAPSRQGGDLSVTGGATADAGVSAYVESVMAAATAVQRGDRGALSALRQASRRARGLQAALAQWEAAEGKGGQHNPSSTASAGYLRSSETQMVRAAAAGTAHSEARAGLITALGVHWSDPLAALVMSRTVQAQEGKRQAVDEEVVPNTLYFYRAQVTAGPFSSEVGPPVAVFTPPLPPFAAVVSEVGPRWARLQWHGAEHGAAKWVVEAAMLESMPARDMLRKYARSAVRVSGAVFAGAGGGMALPDDAELPWAVVASTSSCTALVNSLSANSVYRLRVRGMNAGGVMSAPSLPTDVVTLDNAMYAPLSSHTATQRMTVEVPLARLHGDGVAALAAASGLFSASGSAPGAQESVLIADIVTGDCIAWMEVLLSDGSAVPAETFDGALSALGRGVEIVPPPHAVKASMRAMTASGRWGVAPPHPVGIREIAGVVVSAGMDASSAAAQLSGGGSAEPASALGTLSRVIATRQLLVEVVYSAMKGGVEVAHAGGALKTGYILSRKYTCLNDAVVRGYVALRRCPWEDEAGRWSFMEELAAEYPHLMPLPDSVDATMPAPDSPTQQQEQ